MKPTRRDFIKTSEVAGMVGVNRLSASDISHSEPKITIPTERSKAAV